MKIPRTIIALVMALILAFAITPTALAASPKRMVASVTTADLNRAAMAIKFTHSAMKQQNVTATLFFNVDGVRLVNKNIPSPTYPNGETIHSMIAKFIEDGGAVLACPMCMKNVGGMTTVDLLPGVQSQPGAGQKAMFAEDTLVLSY
ncbi:DsrE family protein [Desulfovibrio ferrophilus]|uniref:Uncharacterized protein n=1 Tax=Desulfovibrio ferrophilus TaxID=241368 RepID=A0A2Z6AUU8_9BACT|nr:DsrE family protein [Desulfovibrio ferrophilus]BBD06956.1 uncharacterized protein DFE_0230 [Desulfovibrio ferrophilus]